MVFQACPGNFGQAVLTVPQDVIWVNPVFPVCQERIQVNMGGPATPPSIVFIIDNSGSMSEDKDKEGEGNDPGEARFNVVKTLLDSLRAASPQAEVGLVIFTRRLAFDHRDNPFFKSAFPGDTSQHDSFVPLTPLNKVFPDGTTGVDTLKALLKYHGKGNLDYNTVRPGSRPNSEYGPLSTRDGTDITLGFQAAKVAMRDSRAARNEQYFIFLSDGSPTNVDDGREAMQDDFIQGENTPATFTVFFKAGASQPKAPANVVKMTENIRANGYSASNPKSDYWALNLPGSQLLALLQSSVISTILTNAASKPKGATLETGGKVLSISSLVAGAFTFPHRIPLAPDQTVLSFTYTYSYEDSGKTKEKSIPYTITVKRSPATASFPDSIGSTCREPAILSLLHAGRPLEKITADQSDLRARLTLPPEETCSACPLQVLPSQGPDRETLVLSASGSNSGHYEAGFTRQVSSSPSPGNGKLEHSSRDSIVLIYRNPENPLDSVRRSFPYLDAQSGMALDYHNTYSQGQDPGQLGPSGPGRHWILAGSGAAAVASNDPGQCCSVLNGADGTLSPEDSAKYAGLKVEASRAFRLELRVFSTLGQFVNMLTLTVPQSAFPNLESGNKEGRKRLRILWGNRAHDGSLVGTGAYVIKSTLTLLKVPGISEVEETLSDVRVIGVIR
ncbi:MAG: vWA domain-containing protein [Fibrobacteria bacterium]